MNSAKIHPAVKVGALIIAAMLVAVIVTVVAMLIAGAGHASTHARRDLRDRIRAARRTRAPLNNTSHEKGNNQMRSVMKGTLGFGLVSVPVKLFTAIDNHDLPLHQYHADPDCHGPIGYAKVCKDCGTAVDTAGIVKGTEVGDGVVFITNEDLETLATEQGRQMEIVAFVYANDVDAVMFDTSYLVGPEDPKSPKAYGLLAHAMTQAARVGIVRFQMRGKQRLGVLRVIGATLVIHTLHWADEIRDASQVQGAGVIPKFSDAEAKAAGMLIESLATTFNPADYTDLYQERLRELVSVKADGGEFVAESPEATLRSALSWLRCRRRWMRRPVRSRPQHTRQAGNAHGKARRDGRRESLLVVPLAP